MISGTLQSPANESTNISCASEKVAPWGSFYPVYSKRHRRIYFNEICATQNNVTEYDFCTPNISCPLKVKQNFISDIFDSLTVNSFPDECEVLFNFPGLEKDVESEICFEDAISTCHPNFEFYENSTISALEIVTLCKSGLYSPFRHYDVYLNVFCFLCNQNYLDIEIACDEDPDIRGISSEIFSYILRPDIVDTIGNDVIKINPPLACRLDSSNKQVRCWHNVVYIHS